MKKSNPDKKILQGTIKKHPEGFGFVIPDDNSHPDIYVPSTLINSAFTNDIVTVSVQRRKGEPDKFYGAVESIVKRHKEFAVGVYEIIDDTEVIQKHNISCNKPIIVQNPNSIPISERDYIKVKITQYPDNRNDLIGEVVKNLGPITSSAQDDIKRTLSEYDIPLDFPDEVLEELNQIPDTVREEDFADRKDLRDKNFVTIDNKTAKDFDDAIYVEKQDFGYRLFVAIADVSYYVKENSLLDKESFARGNSTYLPDFCVPMLPEKLSNELCSLNPLQTRLVMVSELDYDFKGDVITSQTYPSVIISKKRLTYDEVENMLNGTLEFEEGLEFLKSAQDLAKILMKEHYKTGALNLEIEETTIVINDLGEPIDFIKEKRLFSHQLIEQFMLAANKSISAFLEKNKIPLMYRIHEDPKEDKLKHLETFSKTLGHLENLDSRKNIISFLSKYKDHEKSPIINKLVLQSLSQARYSAYNKGHYGLNFKSYTHFTSPIRRYCDLMIHRFIKQAIDKSDQSCLNEKEIEEQALSISGREQNSVKAERQVKDIKKARFLSQHLGENFSGVISSITSFGIFISLKDFDVEGLIRLRELPEHWIVDEINLSMTAKGSGYTMKFGDEVEIQVVATNPLAGNIDFELLTHKGNPLPKPKPKPYRRDFDGRRGGSGRGRFSSDRSESSDRGRGDGRRSRFAGNKDDESSDGRSDRGRSRFSSNRDGESSGGRGRFSSNRDGESSGGRSRFSSNRDGESSGGRGRFSSNRDGESSGGRGRFSSNRDGESSGGRGRFSSNRDGESSGGRGRFSSNRDGESSGGRGRFSSNRDGESSGGRGRFSSNRDGESSGGRGRFSSNRDGESSGGRGRFSSNRDGESSGGGRSRFSSDRSESSGGRGRFSSNRDGESSGGRGRFSSNRDGESSGGGRSRFSSDRSESSGGRGRFSSNRDGESSGGRGRFSSNRDGESSGGRGRFSSNRDGESSGGRGRFSSGRSRFASDKSESSDRGRSRFSSDRSESPDRKRSRFSGNKDDESSDRRNGGGRDFNLKPRSRPQFQVNSRFKKDLNSEGSENTNFRSYTKRTTSNDSGDRTYAKRTESNGRNSSKDSKPFRSRSNNKDSKPYGSRS